MLCAAAAGAFLGGVEGCDATFDNVIKEGKIAGEIHSIFLVVNDDWLALEK